MGNQQPGNDKRDPSADLQDWLVLRRPNGQATVDAATIARGVPGEGLALREEDVPEPMQGDSGPLSAGRVTADPLQHPTGREVLSSVSVATTTKGSSRKTPFVPNGATQFQISTLPKTPACSLGHSNHH